MGVKQCVRSLLVFIECLLYCDQGLFALEEYTVPQTRGQSILPVKCRVTLAVSTNQEHTQKLILMKILALELPSSLSITDG